MLAFLTLYNVSSKYRTGLAFLILESAGFYKNLTSHNSSASQKCISARESPLALETEISSACQELFSIQPRWMAGIYSWCWSL